MSRPLFLLAAVLTLGGVTFWILWPLGLVRTQAAGWSAASAGLFAAATWAACLVLLPFAQKIVARFGHRAVVLASKLVLAVACLGYLFAFEGWLAWLWAMLLGASFGLRWPALDAWAVELTPAAMRGRMLAVLETVAGATMVAGPAIAALVGLGHVGALTMIAAGATVVSVALLPFVPSPPTPQTDLQAGGTAGGRASATIGFAVLAAALCGGLFESGFMAAGPLIATAKGLSAEAGLWVAVLVGVGSVAVQMLLGWGADRLGAMRVLALCAAGLALAFGALAVVPSALAALSVVIGGLGGGLYTLAAIHGVQTNGAKSAGAIGLAAASYTLGSLGSPALTGAALDGVGPIATVGGMAAVSAALWIALAWRGSGSSTGARR